jgi:F-type H+-transporting ATPase subunit epsilon
LATLRLEIITAERTVFDGDVDVVVAPGSEGDLAILPQHVALMTLLQSGELRYRRSGDDRYLAVSGGFMEVTGERVTVLADTAERVEEIDEARAQEAMERARERVGKRGGSDTDLERAVQAMRRSQVRFQLVRRRRGGRQEGAPRPPESGS